MFGNSVFLSKLTGALSKKQTAQEKVSVEPSMISMGSMQNAKSQYVIDAVLVAAAIAASLGKNTDAFIVHSIRRVDGTLSPWTQAGRFESVK